MSKVKVPEQWVRTQDELLKKYSDSILASAEKVYNSEQHRPLRILGIATGPDSYTGGVSGRLSEKGIEHEITMTDISPSIFKIAYEQMLKELGRDGLRNLIFMLADAADLRKDLRDIYLADEKTTVPLEQIFKDKKYRFLGEWYDHNRRNKHFDDESFDLVTGLIPYSSIRQENSDKVIHEVLRVLRKGGYHIFGESDIEEINSEAKRSEVAVKLAKFKHIDFIKSKMNEVMKPVALFSTKRIYDHTDSTIDDPVQYGDRTKNTVFVYKKDTIRT